MCNLYEEEKNETRDDDIAELEKTIRSDQDLCLDVFCLYLEHWGDMDSSSMGIACKAAANKDYLPVSHLTDVMDHAVAHLAEKLLDINSRSREARNAARRLAFGARWGELIND